MLLCIFCCLIEPSAVRNEWEAAAHPTAAVPEGEPVQEYAEGSDRGEQEEKGDGGLLGGSICWEASMALSLVPAHGQVDD